MSYVGPNGRLYRNPARKRWPMIAVALAVLLVGGVTFNVLRPIPAISVER